MEGGKKKKKREKPRPGAESGEGAGGRHRQGWGGFGGFPAWLQVVSFSEVLALGDAGDPLGNGSHQRGGTA